MVYFGSKESMEQDGKMSHLNEVAQFDMFSYPSEPIQFYYNSDENCKAKRNFEKDEPAVALYVHKEVLPFTK